LNIKAIQNTEYWFSVLTGLLRNLHVGLGPVQLSLGLRAQLQQVARLLLIQVALLTCYRQVFSIGTLQDLPITKN